MRKPAWHNSLLDELAKTGEAGSQTVDYLRAHHTGISFRKRGPSVGALWTPWRSIQLNTLYLNHENLNEPRLLSLIVHETRHLQQGIFTALSVYGELDAWQVDFNFQKSLTGEYPHALVAEICALPLDLDRTVLKKAQTLMQAYAGKGYRIDLLPLYPLPREICYWLAGR